MQYIEGQPLDRAIAQLRRVGEPDAASDGRDDPAEPEAKAADTTGLGASTWKSFSDAASLRRGEFFRTVARLGVEAADALEHAHQCGVVHRDVKPSNLLLDERGQVWITDFGLARFASDASLTATGDVLGTIRYMSPEQAAGNAALVDHRTDVYSLGITLYELATLRDAFDGSDRQAFLRWIAEEEPRAPRRLNPAIPVDLETILLKSIAKLPQDRYATAAALADDLRHFLDGRPVLARRAGLADRAGKWARRHVGLVASVAALLVVVLVGSVASTWLVAREHARTKTALAEAEANLDRAETHFRQLREVVDRFGAYHAERLKDLPGAEPLRRELLLDTLAYYQQFIRHAGDDPALLADLAVTYSKAAAVTEQTGDRPAALAAHQRAIASFEKLAAANPDRLDHQADLALCRNNLGLLYSTMGRPGEAEAAYRQALAIQKRLVARKPDSDRYRGDLALTWGNLGLLLGALDRPDEARRAYHEAIELQQQLVEESPKRPEALHNLAVTCNNLSFLEAKIDPVQAEASSARARAIQERLAEAHPENADYQSDLALSYNNVGALESHNGRPDKAEASYRRAIALGTQLVRKAPSVPRFRRDLAVSHNNLGRVLSETDRPGEAAAQFELARAIMQQLVDDDPGQLAYRSSLGGILNNLARALERADRRDEAAATYRQAIEHQRFAWEHAPGMASFREFLARHYANYRQLLRTMGRWDEELQASVAQRDLWQDAPERLYRLAVELVETTDSLGPEQAVVRQERLELAVATLDRAMDAGLSPAERIRDNPAFRILEGTAGYENLLQRLTTPRK